MSYIHKGSYGNGIQGRCTQDKSKANQISDKLCQCGVNYKAYTKTGVLKTYCASCANIKGKEWREKVKKGKTTFI